MTNTKASVEHVWAVPVSVASLSEAGQQFDLPAPQDVRAALAKISGLRSLPRLDASFVVTQFGRDGAAVTGTVSATAGQQCVVTLEPIDSEMHEAVAVTFVPARPDDANVAHEIESTDIESADDEGPDPLVNGVVDLGAIAVEYFFLGIDPHPRKPGATFEAFTAGEAEAHPFAALAALKK